VLVKPEVARELRTAAEFATQERRFAGGLLYGHGWADDQGAYLVIDGYLEAGPGENSGDRISGDGADRFTLSAADLRLLREDAARMYSGSLEAGWWRTLAALGEFGPQDFVTQAELVGPDGVGLLVTVRESTGEPPTWGRTATPPTRPGRSSRPPPLVRHPGLPRVPDSCPSRKWWTSGQAKPWLGNRCRPVPGRRRPHRRGGG